MLGSPILASVAVDTPPDDRPPGAAAGPVRVPATLRLHEAGSQDRREVESFISDVYARRFAARVTSFAPTLVSVRDGDGIVAAAGYRIASEPLFLERYLDAPIEAILADKTGIRPARESIVEIGQLAVRRPHEGRRLFPLLAMHLAERHLRWGVSTLTAELRHLLARMGVHSLALGPADPARLGASANDWGDYYAHHPVVVAGRLSNALMCLTAGRRR